MELVFGQDGISSAALTRLEIFLERYGGSEAPLETRSREWMTSRIVGNFHSELPVVSRRLIGALGATGLVPLEEFFSNKTAVVRRALNDAPRSLLRIPATWCAGRTSDYVAGLVSSKLEE
jgi:hypothetical protein